VLDDISIDDDVVLRLGREGLLDVLTFLWAVDCQTCGRSLDGQAPALCVDELGDPGVQAAVASVHHQACRASTWSPRPMPVEGGFVSYRTQCLRLPDEYLGGSGEAEARLGSPRPMLMVNESLEIIPLIRTESGTWEHMTNTHRYLGLRPLAEAKLDRPITAGWVTVSADTVTAQLGDRKWSAPGGALLVDAVRSYGGITLLFSAMLGPGSPDEFDPAVFFPAGRYEMGWLRLVNRQQA
jgi:hypothetical protein